MNAREYADFFEQLTPDVPIEAYKERFSENATFEDPFHKVTGVEAIYGIFQKMYRDLHAPMFHVHEVMGDGPVAYLRWQFDFQRHEDDGLRSFEGLSRISFDEEGKVREHKDYWDAASNIYEHLPLVGMLLRFIKRRIRGSL